MSQLKTRIERGGRRPGAGSVAVRPRLERVTYCALAFVLLFLSACASPPLDALRGARLYASGSHALESGESARAVAELEEAARLVPHASEIQNHLGLAYQAQGDFGRAQSAFDRALELDCDNESARTNRLRLTPLTRASQEGVHSDPGGASSPALRESAAKRGPFRATEGDSDER